MGLPTITTKWSNIPPEYKIPIPEIYKTIVREINNLPVIDDLPGWPGYYNDYNVRNVKISIETDEMVLCNDPNMEEESDLDDWEIAVCDPYAVFIVPEYQLNFPFAAQTALQPCIMGTGQYPFESLIELQSINFPKWFYEGMIGSEGLGTPGVIAIDIDTREFLSKQASGSYSKLFYPTAVLRIKAEYKKTGESWTNYNIIRRVNLLTYLFGFLSDIRKNSSPEAAAYIKNFESSKFPYAYTCSITPTFIGNGKFGIPNPVINTVYCSKVPTTSASEWATYDCSFAANVSRRPYAAFNNLIFVKDAKDFDSLFDMPYEDFIDRIADGEEEAKKEPGVYDPGGVSKPEGGGGSFNDGDSEDIRGDIPNGSTESNSSSSGLFTRYAMASSDLYVLGAALYTENILATIGKEIMSFLWNSPSDALISLISYPFDVSSLIGTTSAPVKFGSLPLEAVTGARLNGTFAQIDWGSIQLDEFWGNFLDYAPHTKIELYLPWCTGFVSIDPHECLPGSISVVTNIEISKGTCVHNVFGNKGAMIGTYSGTCGSQLPMTALDTSGKALALVTAAAGALVSGAAAGGASSAGIAAARHPETIPSTIGPYLDAVSRGDPSAARIVAQRAAVAAAEAPYRAVQHRASQASLVSAAAAFRTPASIQRSGSFSGNGAGMGIQYPFIIISRPEQNVPENYGRYYGYPSNIYTTLGFIRGYTEVGSVHVNGLSGATLDEIEEIENLLHGGVIL